MYYLMDWRITEDDNQPGLAEIDVVPVTEVPWTMGMYWDEPVKQPISLVIDADSGEQMPDAFLLGIPLFSTRLLDLLTSLGVDNIQTYDAIITDPRTNISFDNYKAVNIVGLVSCANLEESEYIEGSGAPLMYFDRLVLNKDIPTDLHMFRLAESAGTILISAAIAKKIISNKLTGMRLLPLESA